MKKLKTYKFSELYEMSSGISSKPEQAGHGFPFVSFSTVFKDHFLPNDLNEYMHTSVQERNTYSVQEGDIFLTRTSETLDELGMSSVAIKDYPNATYSGFLKRLRPTQSDITYHKFMAFYLRSDLFRKTMNNNAVMTLRASLNEQIFSYLDLVLPPFEEQIKIGDLLHTLSRKIELNNKINTELEAVAKLIYDYWFVQFDFPISTELAASMGKPELEGKPYKTSGGKMVWNEELKREIPEGWEVDLVGNILAKEQLGGKIPSTEYLENGKLPIIDQSTKFICGFTNEEKYRIDAKAPRIVFGDHTRILKLINFDFARGADGTQVLLSNNERVPQHLFYHSLLKIDLSNYGYARHFKFLKDSKIIIPNKATSILFETLTKKWFEMKWHNIKENQKLSELRDWLLPMLMNGQVTVADAKEQVKVKEVVKETQTAKSKNDTYSKIQLLYTTIWANRELDVKQGEMATAKDVYLLDRIYGIPTGFQFKQHNWGSFDPEEKKLLNTKQYFHKPNFPNSKAIYLDLKDDGKLLQKIPSEMKERISEAIREMNTKVFNRYFGTQKAEKKELFATVLKCIEDRKSLDLAIIREEMENWKIKQDVKESTKAEKFSEAETKGALEVIVREKWYRNVIQ